MKYLFMMLMVFLVACGSEEQKPREIIVKTEDGKIVHVLDPRLDLNVDLYSESQIGQKDMVHAYSQLHKSRLSDVRAVGLVKRMQAMEDKLLAELLLDPQRLMDIVKYAYKQGYVEQPPQALDIAGSTKD